MYLCNSSAIVKILYFVKPTIFVDFICISILAFTCPTEKSTPKSVFQEIDGFCYHFNNERGRSYQQVENYCRNVFGPSMSGKVFEPPSLNVNDVVLKAANAALQINPLGISHIFWIGVTNGDFKYKSNGLPVSINRIPWHIGQPSKSSRYTQCVNVSSSHLKWYADLPCSEKYHVICENKS